MSDSEAARLRGIIARAHEAFDTMPLVGGDSKDGGRWLIRIRDYDRALAILAEES